MARIRSRCSTRGMPSAAISASATPSMSYGLTTSASRSSRDGAGKAAEEQHARFVVSRGDELLGDQVHPVVKAADVADVRRAVQLEHFRRLAVPIDQRDRLVAVAGEPRVEPIDLRANPVAELAVSGDARPARRAHLHERDRLRRRRRVRACARSSASARRDPWCSRGDRPTRPAASAAAARSARGPPCGTLRGRRRRRPQARPLD